MYCGIFRLAKTDATKATLHFQLAVALQREGLSTKKDNFFTESCDEYRTALQLDSSLALAHYGLGASLAQLHQDEAARAEFKAFLDDDKDNPAVHPRAHRYADRIELARAKMALHSPWSHSTASTFPWTNLQARWC